MSTAQGQIRMKKIGILGGIGWPSTVEYYAGLCGLAESRNRVQDRAPLPEMAIESLDLAKAEMLVGSDGDEDSWLAFDAYHREALQRLERSGANFAVIACNTAHHRLQQIEHGLAIPILGIVDTAADACAERGVRDVLILGTRTVMASAVFRETFRQRGIDARAPAEERHRQMVLASIDALSRGYDDGASRRIRQVIVESGLHQADSSAAVYLGCTELPLAFPTHKHESLFEVGGIRCINSTALHIQAAFQFAIGGS
ncbi:MAG: aspartate/glutamate racemase family protein [Xanthomonadaceae bacterium]|nr:aspartate/glutamate racemase family protein [Xanthomonadaceae bacterium]